MTADLTNLRWRPIVLAAAVAFVASMLVTVLIVTGYAFSLGFQVRGQPDQAQISAFAREAGPMWGPLLLATFTAIAGFWIARRVDHAVSHGVVVGAIAAIAGLSASWPLDLQDVALFAVVVGAGAMGSFLGRRAPTANL